MAIVEAQKSFMHESGGTRLEVIKGSQFSDSAEVVAANPKAFKTLSEEQVRERVRAARGRSDER
jgi:hypothetical protein